MARRQKTWVYNPPKPPKPKVPEVIKAEVERKAAELVESVLKPKYIQPPPERADFNYLADLYTKWYRGYFYFCSTYHCPGPNALSPSFEARFARMEYVGGDGRFDLSFMRHTGEWVELYQGLSVDESLTAIAEDSFFHP